MDFLQMKYFCAVAELENMTEASKRLYVPQPTLSVSLSKLEQELGTRLFDRYNNRIVLNHAGKLFYERCLNLLREHADLLREMQEAAAVPPKEFRLVSSVQVLSAELIRMYLREDPSFRFTQSLRDPKSMINMLKHGDADLAITSELRQTDSTLIYEPLLEEKIFVAMHPSHPLAGRSFLRMPDLKGEAFCLHHPAQSEAGEMDAYFADMGQDPEVSLVASESELIIDAVAMGVGITLVSSFGLLGQAAASYRDSLALIPLDRANPRRTVGLAWIKNHYYTAPQQAFFNYCREFLSSMQEKPVTL